MPRKTKEYNRTVFTPEVIKQAIKVLEKALPPAERKHSFSSEIASADETLTYDTEEEFFANYRKGFEYARFHKGYEKADIVFSVYLRSYSQISRVSIEMSSRPAVEKVFEVLESNKGKCQLSPPPRENPRIFIGHGQNLKWRDLKDHLREKHGYDVEAYEIGARAGLTIQEVLEKLLASSSLALLVLTGEDEDAKGGLHARENVIHELGLFQGRLGWKRAIALFEEGVEEFSNIHGVDQIRFKKGRIQETFGEVLATIKREFPENI